MSDCVEKFLPLTTKKFHVDVEAMRAIVINIYI